MKARKFAVIFVFVNLLILDGAILYIFLQKGNFNLSKALDTNEAKITATPSSTISCGFSCQEYIDDKITETLAEIEPTPQATETPETSKTTVAKTKIRSVSYVPIPGNGSTVNTDWTSISGTDFYLSKSDYPGFVGAYFEANVKLINGNGTAFIRVYDVTHSIAASGSEISSSNQSSTYVSSGAVSLWEGTNHYVIQAKTLTADTAVFESGRLKLITEN